jgi:hypothetical protein
MAPTNPNDFLLRARRAYEWGRVQHALIKSWPVAIVAAVSYALYYEPSLTAAISIVLFVASAALVWYGRVAAQAQNLGLKAGTLAFVLPLAAFHLNVQAICPTATQMLLFTGSAGLAVGIVLSVASTYQESGRDAFLLFATLVAGLCGALGCILFGLAGMAGMVAGVLLSTAPVLIYRRAAA